MEKKKGMKKGTIVMGTFQEKSFNLFKITDKSTFLWDGSAKGKTAKKSTYNLSEIKGITRNASELGLDIMLETASMYSFFFVDIIFFFFMFGASNTKKTADLLPLQNSVRSCVKVATEER